MRAFPTLTLNFAIAACQSHLEDLIVYEKLVYQKDRLADIGCVLALEGGYVTSTVLTERDGAIARVTLNRPEKLNALTKPMWQALGDTILTLSETPDVRCIVLRGAGEKSFAPGNDIAEFETDRANVEQARTYGALMHRTLDALSRCPVPLVAMIHGICVGGGMEIAAACDVRICGETSRFGAPINKLGLVMAHAELSGLVRLLGPSRALEILLEGRIFDAQEALRIGLVTRVVADGDVTREALESASRIAAGAPLVARWHKRFVRELASGQPLSAAQIDEGFACFGTADFQTGYRAFLAKTPPVFEGR
ncbi:Short-chain-enoyl-CoA hydratase [Pandoraea cepalis]|uniref:Short-chain-enoyl-CoA hydratase n=1 Tax=Pandoraea cepalis TaxID=2508294 RepID=A0A5E4WT66_9BURK|nr:Short-chain-enoyl-CoA hydratase [Pandoraea cepalis]